MMFSDNSKVDLVLLGNADRPHAFALMNALSKPLRWARTTVSLTSLCSVVRPATASVATGAAQVCRERCSKGNKAQHRRPSVRRITRQG